MTKPTDLHALLPSPKLWLDDRTSEWVGTPVDHWLRGAKRTSPPDALAHEVRARALGYENPPAVGPTSALGLGLEECGFWLRVDPVILLADLTCVRLMGWGSSATTATNLTTAAATARDFFGDLGLRFFAPSPTIWLVGSDQPFDIQTTAPERFLGADIREGLPVGPRSDAWKTRLTELQMMLHAVGAEPGGAAVNGVWPWGVGARLEREPTASEPMVVTRSAYLTGLAVRTGGQVESSLPTTAIPGAKTTVIDALDIRDQVELAALLRQIESLRQASPGHVFRISAPGVGTWRVRRPFPIRLSWFGTGGLNRWTDA